MATKKTAKTPNNFGIALSMTLSTIVANIILAFLGCDKLCLLVTTLIILMANFVLTGFASDARNFNKVNKKYFSSALRLYLLAFILWAVTLTTVEKHIILGIVLVIYNMLTIIVTVVHNHKLLNNKITDVENHYTVPVQAVLMTYIESELTESEPDILATKTELNDIDTAKNCHVTEPKIRKVYSPVFRYVFNGEEHKTVDYRTYANKLFESGDRVDILLSEEDKSKCRVKDI